MSEHKLPDTKLLVLDGLPGSGKSTNGRWLASLLERNGVQANWLPEDGLPHPLWWYPHWDGANFLPPDFDNTPLETFIETSLKKWQDFVAFLSVSEEPYIAESVFFQNAVAMFVMGGAEPARLVEYAHQVQTITRDLNPSLIYFYQADVGLALRKICDIRGQGFEQELLKNMERFPYLKRRGLTGLAGLTLLWQAIQRLTDALFADYTIPKLAIETSASAWPHYRWQMLDFLAFPFPADEETMTG